MNRIWRAIAVDARMDRVFGFLSDPKNLADVWPNLIEVRHIQPAGEKGAYDFDAAFLMAQKRLDARAESVDVRQYNRLKIRTSRDLQSIIGWQLAPIGGDATRVTVKFEFETPRQSAEHDDALRIVKENERGVNEMLKNLKNRVEAESAYAEA